MECIRRIIGAIAVIGLVLALPGTALAHHPGETGDHGLMRVKPSVGPALWTHGRDPRPSASASERTARGLPSGVGFDSGDQQRSPICANDYYEHILYANPSTSANRVTEVRDKIRASMRRTDAVLNAESLASGGGSADYKVLCDGSGNIAVDHFTSSGSGFSQIVASAREAGFDSYDADYLIFYDKPSSGSCGIGSFFFDESLSADNANNTGGGYAVVYSDCWQTEIPMHESGHTMGAVQYGAPHSTGSGSHCWDEEDVMCYSPDGGDLHQGGTVRNCSGGPRFDCGFDDYFDAAPEPGEYLASHWNLGSPLNRMIIFGDRSGGLGDVLTGVVQNLLGAGRKSGSGAAVAGGPGEWRMFKLEVTRPSRAMRVRIEQPPGAPLALYVRRMREPTASAHACVARATGTRATCRIRHPRGGRWYAGVLSSGPAGAPFRLHASLLPRRR